MRIPIRRPTPTRTASLNWARRILKCNGGGLGLPNPNDKPIILTRADRLTRTNGAHGVSRVRRFPIRTRLKGITSSTMAAILTRQKVMDRRTRMTRLGIQTRRRTIFRGYVSGYSAPIPCPRQIRRYRLSRFRAPNGGR